MEMNEKVYTADGMVVVALTQATPFSTIFSFILLMLLALSYFALTIISI